MLVKTLSLLFAQPLLNLLEAENVTLVGADLKWISAVVVKSVATRKIRSLTYLQNNLTVDSNKNLQMLRIAFDQFKASHPPAPR